MNNTENWRLVTEGWNTDYEWTLFIPEMPQQYTAKIAVSPAKNDPRKKAAYLMAAAPDLAEMLKFILMRLDLEAEDKAGNMMFSAIRSEIRELLTKAGVV